MKMARQTISMPSVRPHGGSQGESRTRGSEDKDSEEGRSTKASARITAMATPRPLEERRKEGRKGLPDGGRVDV